MSDVTNPQPSTGDYPCSSNATAITVAFSHFTDACSGITLYDAAAVLQPSPLLTDCASAFASAGWQRYGGSVSPSADENTSYSQTLTLSNAVDGVYLLGVRPRDGVGLTTVKCMSVRIDTVAPLLVAVATKQVRVCNFVPTLEPSANREAVDVCPRSVVFCRAVLIAFVDSCACLSDSSPYSTSTQRVTRVWPSP